MKKPMGRNRTMTRGRQRDIASSGRRTSKPHLPPLRYCTMSSARPPTVKPQQMMKPSR